MARGLFPTSVVGSMPRPAFVRDLIDADPPLPPEDFERRMQAAIRCVVALQEQAGLDVVTDGEWRRRSYIGVMAELAHGFELSAHPSDGRPWTTVVDRLSPKHTGFIARQVECLKRITSRKIKVALPAPALLGERLWDAERSAKAYPRREDFVRDCVAILRREVELLARAGADVVQIDDPHLCLFVDDRVRFGFDDPEPAADFAVEMTNEMTDGIDAPTLAVHLCRRAGAKARGETHHAGGYDAIVKQLNHLKVHHLAIEFAATGCGDMGVLKRLREDFEIGLGCVSVTPGQLDPVETIVKRVRQALEYVSPERIVLNPDCGFAPGSAADVSLDEAYKKLCRLVAAARVLRERS